VCRSWFVDETHAWNLVPQRAMRFVPGGLWTRISNSDQRSENGKRQRRTTNKERRTEKKRATPTRQPFSVRLRAVCQRLLAQFERNLASTGGGGDFRATAVDNAVNNVLLFGPFETNTAGHFNFGATKLEVCSEV